MIGQEEWDNIGVASVHSGMLQKGEELTDSLVPLAHQLAPALSRLKISELFQPDG